MKLYFFESIFQIVQEMQSIKGTQKHDVNKAMSIQRNVSHLQTTSHSSRKAIFVHLRFGAAYKRHVDISRLVATKSSTQTVRMLLTCSSVARCRQTFYAILVVVQPFAIAIKGYGLIRLTSRQGVCTRTYSWTSNGTNRRKEGWIWAEVFQECKNGKPKKNLEKEKDKEWKLGN